MAVTAFAVRRLRSPVVGTQALIEISNAGETARDVTVTLNANGRAAAGELVHVDGHSSRSLTREVSTVGAAWSAVATSAGDSLDIDNERFALVPPVRATRVRLVTSGNFFLEKALSSNPDLDVTIVSPASASSGDYDVTVCDGCSTPPSGSPGIVIIPPPGAGLEPAPLIVSLAAHAIADGIDGGAPVSPASNPLPAGDADVVLRAGDVPFVIAREEVGRRIVTLNADLRPAAFPLSTAFPVLIANAVEWAAGGGANPTDITAGEPLEWTLLPHATPEKPGVIGPDGRAVPFTLVNQHLVVTATGSPGIYSVTGSGSPQQFAVNAATTTDRARRLSVAAFSASGPDAPAAPFEMSTWLLVAALGLLAAEWRLSARSRGGMHGWRAAIVVTLVIAAAGARIPLGRAGVTAVFVLDHSRSIPLRAQQASERTINAMVAAMRAGDLAGIVTFGSDAAIDRRPSPRRPITDVVAPVSEAGTDIEGALGLARASLAPAGSRRIVLLSDGNETSGDARRAAGLAAAAGINIDVVPLDATVSALPPVVRAVHAPEQVRVGEPFRVTVEVSGPAGSRVPIAMTTDGNPRITRDVAVGPDGHGATDVTDRRAESGTFTYRAAVVSDDVEDAAAGTVVSVSGRPEVLYVSPSGRLNTSVLLAPLTAAGFHVTRGEPRSLPISETALARFDAVILDDVPADALTDSQGTALTRYVEQAGGGLLLLGGASSLEPGAFAQSAIAPLLPVDLRPRSGRRAPPMAFVLVFDKSGSMSDRSSGVTKIELARESAMRAVALMPSGDSLGIIAFDAQPHVIAPLGTAHRADEIAGKLREIEAGGSTAIGPALDLAADWLRRAPATRRHVLLVSDGRTSPADAERLRATARAREFELSVIAIGSDADRPLLEGLAAQTGGHAYFPDDIRQLPQMVARDASEAAGGRVVEERFRLRAPGAHPVLGRIDLDSLPILGGYVVTAAKSGADTILASHLDDPVLAGWRFGLGRVAIYTADIGARWSSGMRAWSGFAPLWTQTARWVARGATSDLLHLHAVETDDGAHLRVDAERSDGRPVPLQDARVIVRTPSGALQEAALHPLEPGRYEASVPMHDAGGYQISVAARDGESNGDARLVRGFYWSGERERSAPGVNRARLAQIAEMAGGRILAGGDSPFNGPRPFAWRDGRPACELLALALFVLYLTARAGITLRAMREWWRNRGVDVVSAREAA